MKSVFLTMIMAVGACAADIAGNWRADWETPQGKVQASYFKQEGE